MATAYNTCPAEKKTGGLVRRVTRHDEATFTCYGMVYTSPSWDASLMAGSLNRFRIVREFGGWRVDRTGGLAWETAIRVSPAGALTLSACGNRAEPARELFGIYPVVKRRAHSAPM